MGIKSYMFALYEWQYISLDRKMDYHSNLNYQKD